MYIIKHLKPERLCYCNSEKTINDYPEYCMLIEKSNREYVCISLGSHGHTDKVLVVHIKDDDRFNYVRCPVCGSTYYSFMIIPSSHHRMGY